MPLDPTLEYRLVTEAMFPNGLVCERCDRHIRPGQPFTDVAESVSPDSVTVLLICVYCTI